MTARNQRHKKIGEFTTAKLVTAFITWSFLFPVIYTYNETRTITPFDFTTLNISNTIYCLSTSNNSSFPVAVENCSKIGAELAFFDDNAEYFRVFNAMSRNNSLAKTVWVSANVTKTNLLSSTFSWRKEAVNASVWAQNEPSIFFTWSAPTHCAQIRLGTKNTSGLAYCNCSIGAAFLCKAIPQCPNGALQCFSSCGDGVGYFDCAQGFTYNALAASCDDVDECQMSRCQQICVNTIGSFACGCYEGYELSREDNSSCVDIDECISGSHQCQMICVNNIGSYQCACSTGYTNTSGNTCLDNASGNTCLDNTSGNTCLDIDECLNDLQSCQQICTNTDGSFFCSCEEGFYLSWDGLTCSDFDECLSESSSNCSRYCNNTVGSYNCWCDAGYRLANDQVTCIDIDECSGFIGNCSQFCQNITSSYVCDCVMGHSASPLCSQTCLNTEGSYLCDCLTGYYLDPADYRTCHDIDECSLNKSMCEVNCYNTPGSYQCIQPLESQLSADQQSLSPYKLLNQCPCLCTNERNFRLFDQFKHFYIESLKRNLKVGKNDLLSHRSLLTSQQDDRHSSLAIGYIGVLVLTIIFSLLVLPDCITVTQLVARKICDVQYFQTK